MTNSQVFIEFHNVKAVGNVHAFPFSILSSSRSKAIFALVGNSSSLFVSKSQSIPIRKVKTLESKHQRLINWDFPASESAFLDPDGWLHWTITCPTSIALLICNPEEYISSNEFSTYACMLSYNDPGVMCRWKIIEGLSSNRVEVTSSFDSISRT